MHLASEPITGTIKRGVKPVCSMFDRSGRYFALTENQADVTCAKCAKVKGFVAAAKPKSKNADGTCQRCFRVQKIVGKTVANHGYTRPGWGHIVGTCEGSRRRPYEVTCDDTGHFAARLGKWILDLDGIIASLEKSEAQLFHYSPPHHPPGYSNRAYYIGTVEVLKGAFRTTAALNYRVRASMGEEKTDPNVRVPSYEEIRVSRLAENIGRRGGMQADRDHLLKKVAEWAPKQLAAPM